MHVANLDICKELYELSGWWDDDENGARPGEPYYCLGYLLRKLPSSTTIFKNTSTFKDGVHTSYEAIYKYEVLGDLASIWDRADTPEDCAVKLAIELFKSGVLTREEK